MAAVSGLYDIAIGLALLLGRAWLVRLFDVPPPVPPVHAELNGLFALAVGAGYALPWRDPRRWRAYLWLMGPFLKGAGAALFVADYIFEGSPRSFLLFALCDGTLAVITLVALLVDSPGRRSRSESTVDSR